MCHYMYIIVIIINRVHTDPGKSWNLKFKFSKPGKLWNQAEVLESPEKSVKINQIVAAF